MSKMTADNTTNLNTDSDMLLGAYPQKYKGKAGYHFAVRSPLASQVTLCLFDDNGNETQHLMQSSGDYWHIWLAGITAGQCYAYRVAGESTTKQPFNSQKLLLDPYGKAVIGKPVLDEQHYSLFLMSDERDNAAFAPKSQVVDETFDWSDDVSLQTPWAETIIYELHVKGFSQLNDNIEEEKRGTYLGLASTESINYLKDLGITAVELLPIAYGADEPHLQEKGLSNYWNYNMLSPFAVESNYWSGNDKTTPLTELKSAVKALHQAGIEVILDVVFNHSAEAEHNHPTFCQRGLSNADFYWLNDDGSCLNYTGCGNTINAAHPATQQWIVDCLCYWVEACHIDGFRFDLGAVLGREPDFNPYANLFEKIAKEPRLKNIKFIAEPWDIGHFGYQLGNFPSYFSEWNDRFRDDMRSFFLYQSGNLGGFAERFAGSSDIFKKLDKQCNLPHRSINLITAHDGFTLADLVRYNDKHNDKNGENNCDGHSHNFSYNHGVEGETTEVAINTLRMHSQKALLSALLLSNGTPMLLAGDEIGHSQQGNNNAYCQDNAIAWLDWKNADNELLAFTKQLIQLRKKITLLNDNQWWSDDNVSWLTPDATPMQESDWHSSNHGSKALQILLDDNYLLLVNGKHQEQSFILPDGQWQDIRSVIQQNSVVLHFLAMTFLYRRTK